MKLFFRFLGIAVFMVFSILLFKSEKEKRQRYKKEETMLCHLKEPFFKKEPASWMEEQIEEDFKGVQCFSKEAIDRFFEKAKSFSPMLVRYRIYNNELYRFFLDGELISLRDNSTEKAIKTILCSTKLPNLDFVISYYDGYPFGIHPEEIYAPIFVTAKKKSELTGILVPDWRSIGHWWMSDIKAIQKAVIPWEKKRPFALWRGGLTKEARYILCHISLKNPEQLDARFSSCPDEIKSKLEIEGLLGDRCSWQEFLSCKYLPYVDGVMCAAPALQWRLLSGSLTFKPDSDEIQWFYRCLKPYVHYVPVKSDLSNLIDQISWAKEHDEISFQIANNAREFAKNNLLYSDVLNYFALVLKKYGMKQNISFLECQSEIKDDSRWINIQNRSFLKTLAEKQKMEGFCSQSTPDAL